MNILVTGAAGFVGRNLVENLKNIRDGKNRTIPALSIQNIYEYDRSNTQEPEFACTDCTEACSSIIRRSYEYSFPRVYHSPISLLLSLQEVKER